MTSRFLRGVLPCASAALLLAAACDEDSETSVPPSPTQSVGAAGSPTSGGSGGVGGEGASSAGGGGAGGEGGQAPLPPLVDFSIGPYESAREILNTSIDSAFLAYDTSLEYTHSAAQGYTLQAVGSYLQLSLSYEIPGGDGRREALLEGALGEIEQLRLAANTVNGGGPAFGLDTPFDAFGDGSENPAYTAYTWQSGMVALGIAEVLRYAYANADLHAEQQTRIADALSFLGDLIDYWTPYYTTVTLTGVDGGYFWYSDRNADAIAVHNTSALVAMASDIYGELVGDETYRERAEACANLLLARTVVTGAGGYTWNYADDGYPVDRRRPEDVSHALVTTQLMRFAAERGWWSSNDMQRVSVTLSRQMWSGHPARLHGFVDGSSGNDSEWTWTRAAVVGYAAHGDAPGGNPLVFDQGRSILLSSYLTRYDRPLTGASVGAPQMLALARMFERRPTAFADDSAWVTVAGPDDTDADGAGAVRFYTVDWDDPEDTEVEGLSLSARAAQAVNANILVDVPDGDTTPVVLSITYRADADGEIQQWDGAQYIPIGDLVRSAGDDGTVRWMRTTVMLDPDRFDYQGGVPGTNVLLQLTNTPSVHRLEATPVP